MTGRPLRIAVVAHVRHPIREPFMGGMEAHCALLVRALRAAGHDVTLFASGDSDASLGLNPISPTAYEDRYPWAIWRGSDALRGYLDQTYEGAWASVVRGQFDVVHNNSLHPAIHRWAEADRVPMLTSLHVPPFAALRDAVEGTWAPWVRFTVPSAGQRDRWSGIADDRIEVAWNGIDLDAWAYAPCGNGRAVWFGRITPNKGTVEAARAALAAGVPLDIVGPIECSDYFEQLRPLLIDGNHYRGQMDQRALAQFIPQASVMVATPMWDEPFGLTVAEAMACGVPVAALDRGAMREVVGDGGVIASDPTSLPDAIRQAMTLDRSTARGRAEACFGAEAMIARYEAGYAAAMDGLGASPTARSSSRASTDALLA